MTNNNSISLSGNFIDWLTVGFLVLWSGGGITFGMFPKWELYLFPVFLMVFFLRNCRPSRQAYLLLVMAIGVTIIQEIKFSGNLNTFLITVIKIIDVFLIASYLHKTNNFVRIFVKFITITSAISLLFWCIDLTPSGHNVLLLFSQRIPQHGMDVLSNKEVNSIIDGRSLWFYLVRPNIEGIPRNAGMFWEAGILAIYSVLALYINIFGNFNSKSITNAILTLTAISTFSTTGYISLMLLVLFVAVGHVRSPLKKSLLFILLFLIVMYVMRWDFMAEKIGLQMSQGDNSLSRFGAMAFHWTQIIRSPFVGYGPFLYSVYYDNLMSPNGWTNLMRIWGIPMTIVFVCYLGKSATSFLPKAKKMVNVGFTIIAVVLVFSQTLSTSVFYYSLYFIGANSMKTTEASFNI